MENFTHLLQSFLADIYFYLPLGIIGIWRWAVWLLKKAVALRYRAKTLAYSAKVSLITPVYNEDPKVFKKALESWKINKPSEIIAVIDHTDKSSIEIFRQFSKSFQNARLIITEKPGKREALADGIKAAKYEIVALVDSDTFWEKDVILSTLPPFADPKIAGVTTRQNVLTTQTLAQKIFDIQLDLRYFDEFPFLAAAGDALVCLSGRTAFYRKDIVLPLCDQLVNETFMGKKVISGDDKRLTYLVLKKGFKVAYQTTARVFTPGVLDLKTYLAQRLRWTRNSLRSDMKAMIDGWVWKRPALAFFQIDKVIQAFAIILSPIYFFVSLFSGLYLGALIITAWWIISRAIKILPHLRRKPEDITVLPFYVIYTFLNALLKIYALFTLNTQSWITRWDKSRLPQFRFIQYVPAYALTMLLLSLMTIAVFNQKQYYLKAVPEDKTIIEKATNKAPESLIVDKDLNPVINTELASASLINEKGELVKKYTVKRGDSLSAIATAFNTDVEDVLQANKNILPNWNKIEPGILLSIPYQDFKIESPKEFSHIIKNLPKIDYRYDDESNTIHIFGRGNTLTLTDLNKKFGNDLIEEISPKEWLVKANIKIENGVTLILNKKEVTRLKLLSTPEKFTWVKTWGGNIYIDGVEISSWDTDLNDYDRKTKDGRSYFMIKYSSRMDIADSDLGYLGFYPRDSSDQSSYGVSWKLPDGMAGKYFVTGEVKNSKFHDNYFGAYTYGATGMVWQGNEFYNNIEYGLDPHDDSNGFLVENNTFRDNGNHGIIFSKRCINNIIRNNLSFNNRLHGIMLDRNSDNNIVEGNTLYNNKDGIALYDSANNVIKNNKIRNNQRGLRANTGSKNNKIINNDFSGNKQYGVFFYGQAHANTVSGNNLTGNTIAMYIKTSSNVIAGNTITQNKTGILFIDNAANNKINNNSITGNSAVGVYTKTVSTVKNWLGQNNISGNGKDLVNSDPGQSGFLKLLSSI